ncbi:hypothetical protein EUGRSUZ_G00610 [Eucalyptus grandis]|uniref:Uncharacterized protein n=2 Tax=Eucalyptus grandis TaxID=71139 RepID=A0ACC3K1N2_EUCGR|nr:hypothetical protein EUGRSUZ_G00610 [Eucalyptus grandis]
MTTVELNNLAFASDADKLLGWNGIQYLFVADKVASVLYPGMFLLAFLAENSICWINTVCYVVAINNFPLHRQVAIGLTTTQAYLLLSSVLPMVVSLAIAPFVRVVGVDSPGADKNAHAMFIILFIITIAIGVYAMVSSKGSVSGALPVVYNAMGMGIFLLSPIVVPLAVCLKHVLAHTEMKLHDMVTEQEHGEPGLNKSRIKWEDHPQVSDQEEVVAVVPSSEEATINGVREEVGAKEMVKRVEFWLYFFVYLLGVMLGLVFLNNLGQIAESGGAQRRRRWSLFRHRSGSSGG